MRRGKQVRLNLGAGFTKGSSSLPLRRNRILTCIRLGQISQAGNGSLHRHGGARSITTHEPTRREEVEHPGPARLRVSDVELQHS